MHAARVSSLAPIVLLFGLLPAACAGPLDLEPEGVRPGLVAEYRSLVDSAAKFQRIEPKPAFYLGNSSPHPGLPSGPFEAAWTGVILLQEPGPIAFSAAVGGELTVQIDGVTVLRGQGEKAALRREPGYYRATIQYRSLANVPARLQLFWEGPTFAREPVPAWRFGHLPAQENAASKHEESIERGRLAVERFGCARCHATAFPSVNAPPPGPALAQKPLGRDWLMQWFADPAKVRADARMPALFSNDRAGYVERWLIANHLSRGESRERAEAPGDHRAGRLAFLSVGCATCHFLPDVERAEQRDLGRTALSGLGDRLPADDLAAFLIDPHRRYPDGRMPRLAIAANAARNIAAYLLLWSKPTSPPNAQAPTAEEIRELFRRVNAHNTADATALLLRQKGCTACHPGTIPSEPLGVALKDPMRGCMAGTSGPHFTFDRTTQTALAAYLAVASRETHASPFAARQRKLDRAGCVRCHQRDSDRPPPIEEIGSTLGGAFLQELPYQRTPRLTNPHQKFTRVHLTAAVRDGVAGLRGPRYSYRMPAYGADAELLVQALAEGDGELPIAADPIESRVADPTVGTLSGPGLIGPQGYSCISCHIWNAKLLVATDPSAVGPDLTRLAGRIRRDWFDRYLEGPLRFHPGTPMPAVFERGKPALLAAILDGDPVKQKDALWSYFAQGKSAAEPRPAPPVPIAGPAIGEPPMVAQIPIRLPDGVVVESVSVLWASNDLLVYDLATAEPRAVLTGAQIVRTVQGRQRQSLALGTLVAAQTHIAPSFVVNGKTEAASARSFRGYERLADGVRLRWQARLGIGTVEIEETLRLSGRHLHHELRLTAVPAGATIELRTPALSSQELPPAESAPAWTGKPFVDPSQIEGSLERPGYRATAFPRPKLVSGEDRILPVALAAHPRDGRVFVASLKTGELFVLRDPDDTGRSARFENYAGGLFQDALSLLAEDDALYVLHRRNLTRIPHADGAAKQFDRVAALPHGVADSYDYAYGLARDKSGGFVLSYAPYANTLLPGSGGMLSLVPGQRPREAAFGFRNPLGWCAGPDGDIFCTDNQGDWVATNKLCHVAEGRYYGFPNRAQPQHANRPAGKTAVWVPYGWARSINGVAYDRSGGKFGPFAGQFFLAELMFGGAIIRANVEKVNGEYQGACFPFWGKGLLGPVCLAFDPKGRLFVGGITEPGWMAQPDRGALFRIDFSGKTPFEMKSIHAMPHGFRVEFTTPVDPRTAASPASYRLEHYRYEYTGAYGSPELDRTAVTVERAVVSADGLHVELTTAPLVKGRVYLISPLGVKSAAGIPLVFPTGAYTLNEVPR